MENRLIKKTLLYFIGNASAKFIQAALIPVYAFFVSSEALGEFDYYSTLVSIFVVITFMATWEYVLKCLLNETDAVRRSEITNNVIALAFLGCAALIAIMTLLSFGGAVNSRAIVPVLLMLVANGFATEWQYFARSYGETKLYVKSGIAAAVVNLILILVLVCLFNLQTDGLVVSYFISQISIILIIEHQLKLFSGFSLFDIHIIDIKKILKYSVPLILNLISLSLMTGVGRLLIMEELGASANGEYVFAMKFSAIITALGSVFTMASVEEAIIRSKSGRLTEYFSDLLSSLWRIVLALSICCIPAIALFYEFIPATEYSGSFYLVPVFILFADFNLLSTNHGALFQAIAKTRTIAVSTICGLAFTGSLSILSISRYGLTGVALSLCLGMLVTLLVRWLLGIRFCSYSIGFKAIIPFIVFYIFESMILTRYGINSIYGVVASITAIAIFTPVLLKNLKKVKSI